MRDIPKINDIIAHALCGITIKTPHPNTIIPI